MELVREIVSSCTFGWGKGIISHDDFIDIDRYLEKIIKMECYVLENLFCFIMNFLIGITKGIRRIYKK